MIGSGAIPNILTMCNYNCSKCLTGNLLKSIPMEKKAITLKDGRNCTIRPITKDDGDSLYAMFASMSDEALRWGMPPYTRENVNRRVTNLKNWIAVVAEYEDRIIGHSGIYKSSHPRRKGVSNSGIYIVQDFHNVGLGSAMMEVLVDEAERQCIHKINLEVVAENAIAIKLYEKLGFQIEGRIRDTYYGSDEKYYDTLMMGKILAP